MDDYLEYLDEAGKYPYHQSLFRLPTNQHHLIALRYLRYKMKPSTFRQLISGIHSDAWANGEYTVRKSLLRNGAYAVLHHLIPNDPVETENADLHNFYNVLLCCGFQNQYCPASKQLFTALAQNLDTAYLIPFVCDFYYKQKASWRICKGTIALDRRETTYHKHY